ncbi:MAG: coproporphyrinogen III oxidase family protein [Hungatella sp.]|nr:coproporphyrinogen III oxidase family protein [Hungatella sp.]
MNPYIQYMYSYPHKTAYGPLFGVNLKDYRERLGGPGHGLYLHLPFCQSKCGYCNLFSVTGQTERAVDRYLDTVKGQMEQYREILSPVKTGFSSFTIGGGTPLLLTEKQLEKVFAMTEASFPLEENREIVIETAPNQTTRGKLAVLKAAGATRVSMGIQSFREEELKVLRRNHSADRAREGVKLLKEFHFPCMNLDFIYGIPGQSVNSLLESLKEALEYDPEEIFLYPLYVKHGAGLERDVREGMVLEPEKAMAEYEAGAEYLDRMGYRQDSMRRFVRQREGDREFSDCGFSSSLALGCGGRSYVGNLHFCTPYAITRKDCLRELEAFENTVDFARITHGIFLSEDEEKRRYVIRHLLIHPGLPAGQYRQRFGTVADEDYPVLTQWMEEGLLACHGDYLRLTKKGMGLSDYLGPKLISPYISRRMEAWDEGHRQDDRQDHGSLPGKFKKL